MLIFALFAFLWQHSPVASAQTSRFEGSPYQIMADAGAIAEQGHIPIVFLDIDDTLIRTAFRYLDVIEALNERFGVFPPWSRPGTPLWRASHSIRPGDIVYADSFEKTLRLTLERLITDQELLSRMYAPGPNGAPIATQVFFDVFFDSSRVSRDPMFKGAVFFLNNLLSLMRRLDGKVVFLSGRADKYLAVTKQALLSNGVSRDLLEGNHVLWYLKPSSGKINFSEDVRLDFVNDKAAIVNGIMKLDSRMKVAGFIDNEARNVFSLVGHSFIPARRLYFFRSVDATWATPDNGELVRRFLDRTRESREYFTQFDGYLVRADQAAALKSIFSKRGARYINREALSAEQGMRQNCTRLLTPRETNVRQLTIHNGQDLELIRDIIVP